MTHKRISLEHRTQIILEAIKQNQPINMTNLMKIISMSNASIGNVIRSERYQHLFIKIQHDEKKPSNKRMTYSLSKAGELKRRELMPSTAKSTKQMDLLKIFYTATTPTRMELR